MKELLLSSVGFILLWSSVPAWAQGAVPFRSGTDYSSGDAVPAYSNQGADTFRRSMRATPDGAIRNLVPRQDPAFVAIRAVPVPKAYTFAESGYRAARRLLTVFAVATDDEGHSVRRPMAVDLGEVIASEAKRNDVDPLIVELIIKHESNFNPYAVSRTGAQGLMQLMPSTAATVGVADSFDPRQNVAGGVFYFAQQLRRFQDLSHALAAYNAGPGAVAACGGVPPLAETQAYVSTICAEYANLRKKA